MSAEEQGWFSSRAARATTGVKMLLLMSLGLLPLGLIAILASTESLRSNSAEHAGDARAHLELAAERVGGALARGRLVLQATSLAAAADPSACEADLQRLVRLAKVPGRYAIYMAGQPLCATSGFRPDPASMPGTAPEEPISRGGQTLRFVVAGSDGVVAGLGEFSREELVDIVGLSGAEREADLFLHAAGRRMTLFSGFQERTFEGRLALARDIGGQNLVLRMTTSNVEISAAEVLMILLPVLMWLAAGLIGWLIVDRLLLKPLARMQRAVADYQPGGASLILPKAITPAREIGDLGLAFERVTQTLSRHEAELEAGLERQKRLVREVHHRVKNNLQVVASLLNLHARGATSPDASDAYASIQRRVDALAVVHRNHFAELEENRGVALKSLLSELGANLRATAPASASHLQIKLAVEPLYVTQDVAVSVAFLVTELVEFAMFCGGDVVAVTMEQVRPAAALLAIESNALRGEVSCDPRLAERFERIVTGLSRQLRSAINKDETTGRYALEVAIVGRGDG